MQSLFAPILLFTHKRLQPLKLTMEALRKNPLAVKSDLYIFSDAARQKEDEPQVQAVRAFLQGVDGFRTIKTKESLENKGLASSIINGVKEVIASEGRVIVLEDDLITSPNFLNFMNQGLCEYEINPKIFSVAGYTKPIKLPYQYSYDNYFTRRASSWGWATWRDRWEDVDWEVSDYNRFSVNKTSVRRFNEMGSDMSSMLSQQMAGKIDSWAIRWCYHQFKKDMFTVFPTTSKIMNIGFGDGATHTKEKYNRFATELDGSDKIKFNFKPEAEFDSHFIKQFVSTYSIKARAYYRLKNLLNPGFR